MAAATPATTPEPSEMPMLVAGLTSFGVLPMLEYMISAALPCTANLAIVYGICLNKIGLYIGFCVFENVNVN